MCKLQHCETQVSGSKDNDGGGETNFDVLEDYEEYWNYGIWTNLC